MIEIVLYILLAVVAFLILPLIIVQFFVALHLYKNYFVRNDKEDWSRALCPINDEEKAMFSYCEKWEEENIALKRDVEVNSDGLKLKGIYYDFGYKRSVIVVAGRSEALRYSYYFSNVYKENKFNVLVIDNRSHGYSEGKYNSLGLKEWRDLIKWAELLHDKFNNEYVVGHGICIGSATLLYAMTNENCPTYFKGLIADGMYEVFTKSFINHAKELGFKSKHFVADFFFMLFKLKTKENPNFGPIDVIEKVNFPMLFIYSKKDAYSTPDQAEKLFNKCGSNNKEIQWFDKGVHSHVRVNNVEKYDTTIANFVNKYFK